MYGATKGIVPGYTGYQPNHLKEATEMEATMAQMEGQDQVQAKIPGYRGYVPGIKSENVFGATYGCTTKGVKEGIYPKGFDVQGKDKFASVTMMTYTNQMGQKVFGNPHMPCGGNDIGMSYEEASAAAAAQRIMDPNPMPKVPMLTQETLNKILAELKRRGTFGIRGLAIVFRRMDNNGDKKLDRDDLRIGLRENGHELTDLEFDGIFKYFDRNGDGKVNFDEFMRGVRGDLNPRRKELVHRAFTKVDKTGDGIVDLRDLVKAYDVSKHTMFIQGKMTKEQILTQFMEQWDSIKKDNTVTREEFENYYADVSSSIDTDDLFEAIMTRAWNL